MKYKIYKPSRYKEIANHYHINSLISKIIDFHNFDKSALESLLNPRLIYHDFSLFEEYDMTLERIHEAIENEEKICIYGDYDCDGILATTILYQALLELGANVGYHIPNRLVDGYGLNVERVKQMEEKGYSLIITVDNGVKAFDAIEYACECGIDVIVTDHHQFDADLPEAFSIIHTRLSPEYPFKDISGGFVAYKLASALLKRQDKYLYCLAAITTVSDMMPLIDENRSLVKKALTFMEQEKYPSIELLLGNNQTYSTTSLGFIVAPKINSFGRLPEMCNPNILVRYFLKDAPNDLLMKVSTLANEINAKRQSLTNEQYKIAMKENHDDFLYFGSSEIHEGIVGLIAGKYSREYERPSFVMHYDKQTGIYKGSARSVDGFSLHDFFTKYSHLFEVSGGHEQAGGFSISKFNYERLHDILKDELSSLTLSSTQEVLLIDEYDVDIVNIESLSMLEPFGQGNEEPLLMLMNVPIKNVYTLSEGKHLKMDIEYPNVKMSALYFNKGNMIENYKDLTHLHLIGTLSVNTFRNIKSISFIVKDIVNTL